MTDEVVFDRQGTVGVMTLNRPKAINALTHDMVVAIKRRLDVWADDADVRAVVIESAAERGFCAGGDVRAVREMVVEGRAQDADRFFVDEYAMNGTIAGYGKPIVALMGGIVMGGGIGIGGHASVRVAADNARFAMPESAIGLMCDVGATALLARVDRHRALAFMMPGLPVGAADALALNLTDHVVPGSALATVKEEVIAAVNGGGAVDLHRVVKAHCLRPLPETVLMPLADALEEVFAAKDAATIVAGLRERAPDDQGAAALAEVLDKRCPTSLEVIVQHYAAAERDPDVASVLAADLKLAPYLVRRADFAEGVRAVLIDKDQAPRWMPAELAAVDRAGIAAVLG